MSTERFRSMPLEEIDDRLQKYRLQNAQLESKITQSLDRYGQMTPVIVCSLEDDPVLIDGFKRLRAARQVPRMKQLTVQYLQVDEQSAKAAIYNLNAISQRPREIEEAWIVHALVREDGLSQVEAAHLLGRHKSWINRRLAILERLCDEAREEIRLGLLTPTLARQLTRLPRGNQQATLKSVREFSLSSRELAGVVDLLLASSTTEQRTFVLSDPRKALRQADDRYVHYWDPRLSTAGNRIAKRLTHLLDGLSQMQSWLQHRGRGELQACDIEPLRPGFSRLVKEAFVVAEKADDFLEELKHP